MKAFLNKRMSLNRNFEINPKNEMETIFIQTVSFINEVLGDTAFRLERGVHSAIYDSIMVGTAKGEIQDRKQYLETYQNLLENKSFQQAYNRATSDEVSVNKRVNLSIQEFSKVK